MRTDEFLLRPILESDAELDYEAVVESRDFLRIWEGGGYPKDGFTVEDNRKDLAKMERRHNEGHSFAYTVMDLAETECFGCVYISPTDVSWLTETVVTATSDARWFDYDTVIQFWVRTSRLADKLDRRLLDALGPWLSDDWPIRSHVVMTSAALTHQVTMIEGAGLKREFELRYPDGGVDAAYA